MWVELLRAVDWVVEDVAGRKFAWVLAMMRVIFTRQRHLSLLCVCMQKFNVEQGGLELKRLKVVKVSKKWNNQPLSVALIK